MRIPRIFQPFHLQENSRLMLSEETSHYLTTVLRLNSGSSIILFNGDGNEYPSIIHFSKKKIVEASIQECISKNFESPLYTHLGQVISKGTHMDFTIQKSVELGVNEITPLYSSRGDVYLNKEREERKQAHWQKIIIHACEQCGRTSIPKLAKPTPLLAWVQERLENTKLVLEPLGKFNLKTIACNQTIALLIGAEGGFSTEEVAFITQQGFISIQLGPRILRTETASLVALSALQLLKGDL